MRGMFSRALTSRAWAAASAVGGRDRGWVRQEGQGRPDAEDARPRVENEGNRVSVRG